MAGAEKEIAGQAGSADLVAPFSGPAFPLSESTHTSLPTLPADIRSNGADDGKTHAPYDCVQLARMVRRPPRPAARSWAWAVTGDVGAAALIELADSFAATGRLAEARDLLAELRRAQPGPATRTAVLARLARVDRLLGDYAGAAAGLAGELDGGDPELAIEYGLACLLGGDPADAWPVLRSAADSARAAADHRTAAAVLSVHALGAAGLGAADARRRIRECAALVTPSVDGAEVDTVARLGWAEVLLDRPDPARTHFTRALAAIERAGHSARGALPYVLLGLGHLARAAGELAHATGLARHVQGIALHTGARDVMCLALTLEASAGAPAAARLAEQAVTLAPPGNNWYSRVTRAALRAIRSGSGPCAAGAPGPGLTGGAGPLPEWPVETAAALPPEPPAVPEVPAALRVLTERQREVAVLVGQGATSKAVARALRISPHTVDVHLARIYRVLGVSSRAGLAALVARAERG
jgi:DNA-binding CsgD family transcriptional regulator